MKMYLHLANGVTLAGIGFGDKRESNGEVVFSTGMTGYVQNLTDPSFAGQILTFTYPLIGNYGVPKAITQDVHLMKNRESERIWVSGVVVASLSTDPSHYQLGSLFSDWLTSQKIPGISMIDTRRLTHIIREEGCMQAIISPQNSYNWKKHMEKSVHWVARTSIEKPIVYASKRSKAKHLALIDCGVKHGILRALLETGVKVTRIPWDMDPTQIKSIDGVVCSNGPGDPKVCGKTIATIQKCLKLDIPFLGICLGHQLLSLAIGADTYKLPYGHRGLNQPCQDLRTGKAFITSQNHGYAVNRKTIPPGFSEWFINLNDSTNEGIVHKSKNIASVQFHPEGNPGPSDTVGIFTEFIGRL